MRGNALLHRSLVLGFVLSTGGIYLVHAAPIGSQATWEIALRCWLALLMLGAWATSSRATALDHRWTLFAGVAARLIALPVAVSFSHDIQRYLWDGAVFWSGLDPYRLAPAAPEVAALRAIWPTPLEHVGITTIYPPGAMFLFGLAASFGPAWASWVWKLFVVAASLGTLWLGAKTLQALGRSRHLPLLALSPLLVMETATGAHLDLLCALSVAAALWLVGREKLTAAGLVLGAGALLKFLPILALLPLAVGLGGRSARRLLGGAVVMVGAGYGAAFALGLRPLGSLPVFFANWRFGSPVFSVLTAAIGDQAALRVAPVLLVLALLFIARLARTDWRSAVPLALAAPLLVSPVVFPWYLAPIVPAVALAPSAFALAWVTTLPLTNEVLGRWQSDGVWQPASWPLWAIGAGAILGLTLDGVRRARARARRLASTSSAAPRVTVVVPVLNEEDRIGEQLEALLAAGAHQLIVVDGGSTDQTIARVRARAGVTLISAARGRATQMNAGAALATGDVLLFLHADVRLPADAARWISTALSDPAVVGGAFRTWTVPEGRRSWLAPLLHLADVRSRYTTLPYGDQALFVRTAAFEQVGGFPDQPLMEDLELGRRLWKVGALFTVPAVVRVSGRRFLARPAYYTLLVNLFPLLYRLGMPPRLLAALYGNPR